MAKDYIKALSKNQIIYHCAIWLFLFILLAFPFGIPNSLATLFPTAPAVYLHFLFIEKLFKRKKYILYVLCSLATLLLFGILATELTESTFTVIYYDEIRPIGTPFVFSPYYEAAFNPFIGVIIATALSHLNRKQKTELEEIKLQKTKAELDLLKSQVNPHFFFNTLNTLFSMASLKGDEETAEGISQLSGLMRYMIYDSKVELISLDKEIEHIRNFIELQELRFLTGDNIQVKFEILGDTNTKTIPPMLLIPFIENAYKFGFSLTQKSEIFIQLNLLDAEFKFRVLNTINKKMAASSEHSGIGINNVRRRLELLYPDSHHLDISENNNYFSVYLKLPL